MMIKRVSCVFRLVDSVLGSPLTANQAELTLNGEAVRPVYKTGGYFVLIDLPEGEYRIGIRSALFQPDEIPVRVSYEKPFDERRDVISLMMNPSPRHPAAHTGVTVTGRLEKGRGTVFYMARNTGGFKIAEDMAAAGNQSIKLFAHSGRTTLPVVCLINDKDPQKAEMAELIASEGDSFHLAAPLRVGHKRSTELIPMIRFRSGEDGRFFVKLPAGYSTRDEEGKLLLRLFIPSEGGMTVQTLSVSPKGETDVGVL